MQILGYTLLLALILSRIIINPSQNHINKNVSPKVLSAVVNTPTEIPATTIPTSIPKPTKTPKIIIQNQTTASIILGQINSYRNSLNLPSLTTTSTICSFANTRALEIVSDFSHSGFQNRVNNHTMPYSYHFAAENIAETSDPNQVFTLWRNSPGHDANMKSSATYGCLGQNGNFYALELWTP